MTSGITADRLIAADADTPLALSRELSITAIASAHEELEVDAGGHSKHLGYVLQSNGLRLYHSGDCVPYSGPAGRLTAIGVDVALLPTNGRDEYRRTHGVPGNFHPQEAVRLAATIGADVLVGHHFGMFEFNTVNEQDLLGALEQLPAGLQWVRPKVGKTYLLVDVNASTATGR